MDAPHFGPDEQNGRLIFFIVFLLWLWPELFQRAFTIYLGTFHWTHSIGFVLTAFLWWKVWQGSDTAYFLLLAFMLIAIGSAIYLSVDTSGALLLILLVVVRTLSLGLMLSAPARSFINYQNESRQVFP